MTSPGSLTFLAVDGPRRAGIFPLTYGESEGQAAEKPRILIVDDERLLAETTATILRRAGFNARTAYDGFHALETANAFHPEYLLTDIMMPAMNGVELAIAVIRMFPATRILLFSGQAGISNIMEESRSRGFEFPLLAKPVHPTQLIDSLKALKES